MHAASSWLYGVASSGEVGRSANAPNAWEALDVARQRCPGRIVAAVEAGCNWPWLVCGLLKPDNRRPPVRSLFGTTGHAWLAQVELPAPFRSTLNGRLAVEAEAARQIEGYERELWPLSQRTPLMRVIAALPQAGPCTATTIVLASGDLARFRRTDADVAHCGLTPWTSVSAGKSHPAG